jgi:Uma2 family endonuclease
MSTLAQRKMTVDEFLVWAEGREGRWELYNGVPYRMAPERTGHIEIKVAVHLACRPEKRVLDKLRELSKKAQ